MGLIIPLFDETNAAKDAQTIINKLKARARACNEVLKCP